MSKFIEIGEIVEILSEPVNIVKSITPDITVNSLPKTVIINPKTDYSIFLIIIIGICIGFLLYKMFKNSKKRKY